MHDQSVSSEKGAGAALVHCGHADTDSCAVSGRLTVPMRGSGSLSANGHPGRRAA